MKFRYSHAQGKLWGFFFHAADGWVLIKGEKKFPAQYEKSKYCFLHSTYQSKFKLFASFFPLCVVRKMTVGSENIDNAIKISQTNKERERTFIFLKHRLCDMCWYIYRSQIPRLDRHQRETRQRSSLGSSGPAPRSRGLRLRGASGVAPAAFQRCVWDAACCSHSRHCKVISPLAASLTEDIRLLLFMARVQK